MELVDMRSGASSVIKQRRDALPLLYAGMMKLVNMLDLGSSAARLVGSSPTTRTSSETPLLKPLRRELNLRLFSRGASRQKNSQRRFRKEPPFLYAG